MFFPLSILDICMSKQFVQKSFDLILLINNYYFEELAIKYMHKSFTVLLYYESLKQFSAESSVLSSQKNNWRFKQQMQYIALILNNRPSLHLPNSILKTLQYRFIN